MNFAVPTPTEHLILVVTTIPLEKGFSYDIPGLSYPLVICAPISMHVSDQMVVDTKTGKIEIVQRDGIVIWRRACLN